MDEADNELHRALLAFGDQDLEAAVAHARRACGLRPDSRVCSETATYLERVRADGKQRVYVDPRAFSAFIRAGGNLHLYRATSAALRAIYDECSPASVLDIGVGDGSALLPALGHPIAAVTLVEPSPMLTTTLDEVRRRGVSCEPFQGTVQEFMSRARPDRRWDVAQATFSLQSVPPVERGPVLRWLRSVADRVLIAEFDVPRFPSRIAREHFEYVRERYERGLAEYEGDGGLVAQGFLVPVMCGYFDPSVARTNYEQPAADWIAELRAAGFQAVDCRALDAYWWATAVLIDARATAP